MNYYERLEVPENAGQAEIKAAYRRLAKRFHPDLNPDPTAEQQFMAIEEAHACLIKADSRKAYDMLLRFKREGRAYASVEQKYQNDIRRSSRRSQVNAQRHAKMSYDQYQRDELLRMSALAIMLQTIFTIIAGALLLRAFYQLGTYAYGPHTGDWGDSPGIYLLGMGYLLSLIVVSYLYEPLVRYLVIGKPKRK